MQSLDHWTTREVPESNVNWSYRRNSWPGNADTATIWYTQDIQPEELSENIDISEEGRYEEKDEHVLEKVTLAKIFTL